MPTKALPKGLSGRPMDKRRAAYMKRFKITSSRRACLILPEWMMERLDRCKDDDARRVLLGIKT